MHLAGHEDTAVDQVFLCGFAEVLVFGHDAFVQLVDVLELFLGRVSVTIDFVVGCGLDGAFGFKSLDHEEVGAVKRYC